MKRKPKVQLVDVDDPEGSLKRVADDLEKRQIRRKAREFRKRKRHLIEDTPNAVSWLGRSFYRPVAAALLADHANFDEDGMPTEDAMQQAVEALADAAVNILGDIEACDADDIFHRIRLEAFAKMWGLDE